MDKLGKKPPAFGAEARPREKCLKYGAEALTDQELLAVILRTGSKGMDVMALSDYILCRNPQMDGLVSLMYQGPEDYREIPGVGQCKSVELCVVGEIAKRIWKRRVRTKEQQFTKAKTVADYFKEELRYLDREVVHALYLDNRMQLIRDVRIASGTCNQSSVSARDVFIEALRCRAVCLILVHNHPSGDPSPSVDDARFTRELSMAGDLLGIALLDHVIIGDNQYYSFKEQGMLR